MKPFKPAPVLALLPLLMLAACESPDEGIVESRARAVLDAQYAADGKTPPMQAEEADRIYENYLDNIGKPMETGSATNR
ncbi:MAG: hypothetical protein C0454_01905 [Parvibaculum sp.]|nr:hypothetical protein [Parvibaculum sp.]